MPFLSFSGLRTGCDAHTVLDSSAEGAFLVLFLTVGAACSFHTECAVSSGLVMSGLRYVEVYPFGTSLTFIMKEG